MIIVIRIAGNVDIWGRVEESLSRIRLRRKYSAVLLKETKENLDILNHLRNFVAFGKLTEEQIEKLISARGIAKDKKKVDAKKVIQELKTGKVDELSIKPFFRLHPPRSGIDSKLHFGTKRGVLGDHKDKIFKLLERML
ncbi:MAG: hypothetical protein AABW80_01220 [Nanoarchaeota archaeon]